MTVQAEITELRRRVEASELQIAELQGSFGFISNQLRDIQRYMHAKFSEVDTRLDKMDSKLDAMNAKIDSLPAILARTMTELLDARLGKPN